MTGGFEGARAQRNWLERLGEKIPGYRGFQDRELRREVDKLQREHLASQLSRIKGLLRKKAQEWTDAGKLGELGLFDRLDRRLDGLALAIRFADYQATGLFDVVKVSAKDLGRLYQFDLSLIEDISALRAEIGQVPVPGDGDSKAGVDAALARVAGIEEKWSERERVISDVVRAAE